MARTKVTRARRRKVCNNEGILKVISTPGGRVKEWSLEDLLE